MNWLRNIFRPQIERRGYSVIEFKEKFQSVPRGKYRCFDLGVTGRHFLVDGEGNLTLKQTKKQAPMELKMPEEVVIVPIDFYARQHPYKLTLNVHRVIEARAIALRD